MRSHRRIRSMACLLLVALLLSGCQIGNTKVVFLKPVGYHQVFKIDKEVCRKKEAKVYLTNYMNIYGNAYGVSLRKQKSVQEDLEQYVKDLTISQLSKIKCMNGIAKEQKIELTKEEEQIAEAAAKEYYESLSKEERKYMGVSQSLITKMYSEYLLASKPCLNSSSTASGISPCPQNGTPIQYPISPSVSGISKLLADPIISPTLPTA